MLLFKLKHIRICSGNWYRYIITANFPFSPTDRKWVFWTTLHCVCLNMLWLQTFSSSCTGWFLFFRFWYVHAHHCCFFFLRFCTACFHNYFTILRQKVIMYLYMYPISCNLFYIHPSLYPFLSYSILSSVNFIDRGNVALTLKYLLEILQWQFFVLFFSSVFKANITSRKTVANNTYNDYGFVVKNVYKVRKDD